jgi:N-acetyl-gamma-glutamyl-phosphate reductase
MPALRPDAGYATDGEARLGPHRWPASRLEREAQMTATIFIDGEAGTTGLGIRDRLTRMSGIVVKSIAAEDRKNLQAKRALMSEVDVAILCLPDEAAKETVALVKSMRGAVPKLLDASSAHRVTPEWVYGFAELTSRQAEAIRAARYVANPGCYATGAIALLRPLVEVGLMPKDLPVTINAVSGYSGGGRPMVEAYEAHRAPDFELYGLGLSHKHIPEIVAYSGLSRRPIFVPSVGNFRQGMLVCVPLHLDQLGGRSGADLEAALIAHYAAAEAIRVVPTWPSDQSARIEPQSLNGSDAMELRVFGNGQHAVLVAKLDNLGKGASGAAVQNLRLMLGA